MSPRFALLAALCVLNPTLKADSADVPLRGEARIVPGNFAASDEAAQPVALWLEQGSGALSSAALPADTAPALRLPAQQPAARACLLLDAPEAAVASLRLRLKLEAAEAAAATEAAMPPPEMLEWELAGVPLRFVSAEAGTNRWQVDYHTAESGWRPLLAPEGEDLGTGTGGGWHTLTLQFAAATSAPSSSAGSAAPRSWRLRWDEREPGPWIAQTHAEPALLVIGGGLRTTVWLDDVASTSPASVEPAGSPSASAGPETAAAALAARNAALREEIAAALRDLTRETGVRRQLLRRSAGLAPSAPTRTLRSRGLTVLTPLEERQEAPTSPSE